jgi:hypothetical protein
VHLRVHPWMTAPVSASRQVNQLDSVSDNTQRLKTKQQPEQHRTLSPDPLTSQLSLDP